MEKSLMYYGDYLYLDTLLTSQHPVSFSKNYTPAHDEMLFIITHQTYELWFKQILFELDYVIQVFGKEKINDNSEDLNLVRHRLNRVIRILELVNQQVNIMETMTPLDFLEFRNLLTPSSGFQSKQFRLIEAKLGLEMGKRHQYDYYKKVKEGGFTRKDYDDITETENNENILQRINRWLERMPFFEERFWLGYTPVTGAGTDADNFWRDYREIYHASLTEREKGKIHDFDYVFFERTNHTYTLEQLDTLRGSFSSKALRAALFIMLYRDFPVFQTSYQILDSLIEIDNMLSNWRYRHYIMVRRMIGLRVGTGNTSGAGYLEGALSKHHVYKDLAGLSTYLIERRNLPALPRELVNHLSFAGY
ncbi:MAG TPA: tryptophan 2,3-dioxygenase family protein [Chitinophagaceae bacterium]|nr:tryptophan 2,3-dioxygenase family protein [Chitinophagaceae bacterium]